MQTTDRVGPHKLARCHQQQLDLCDALEWMADGLPGLPTPGTLLNLDGSVSTKMRRFAQQWAASFAALAVAASGTPFAPLLDDLSRQDQEDIGQADEIQATIEELKSGRRTLCPEGFGYLLRGFVVARRRRVALDRALLGSSLFESALGFPAREARF
jgi:hypothetical protein